jgi:hypothetical protein
MAQDTPRFCPRCGAPLRTGQRVCANCGLDIPSRTVSQDFPVAPQAYPPSAQSGMPVPDQATLPQYPASYPQSSMPMSEQGAQYLSPFPGGQNNQQVPPASVVKPAQKRSRGRVGCVIGLLLVAVLGIAAIFGAVLLGVHLPGTTDLTTQTPVTTTSVNETVTYAGVAITVLNAQQSQRFVNDPNTGNDGMLRLNLKEQNSTNTTVSWSYAEIARLVLPGGSTVSPVSVKAQGSIAPGATQSSIVDFVVPTTTSVRKIVLRLGSASEAQMDIPLTGQANLSKYAPHSVQLNGQMLYMGLNWTLTQATSQLSIAGQQASKGKRYIIVTLSVDNTLSQETITGSPYTYIRLQVGNGNTLLSPQASTLPVSFATGETGKTGTVTFLAPQNSSSFTLLLQQQGNNSGFDPASSAFQLS